MAPSASKANYKTYEAQARLVRAIVAAHPSTKWNYKEIAACYGSDMTEHALNHRFRYIRAQSEIVAEGRKAKLDMKYLTTDETALPKTVGAIDKKNIAKYFGQSTADGIQFQFRGIKKDADKMRTTADNGGDPSNCLDLGTGSGPSFTPTTTPKTPRSRNFASATPTTGGASTKRGRGAAAVVKIESDDEDDEDSESTNNWSEMEATPSKRPRKLASSSLATPGQKNGTPSRLAAARASATIADSSAQLQTSESEADAPIPLNIARNTPSHAQNGVRPAATFATATVPVRTTPVQQPPTTSLFGNVPAHPSYQQQQPPPPPAMPLFEGSDAFKTTGTDAYLGNAAVSSFYDDDDAVDGEI